MDMKIFTILGSKNCFNTVSMTYESLVYWLEVNFSHILILLNISHFSIKNCCFRHTLETSHFDVSKEYHAYFMASCRN